MAKRSDFAQKLLDDLRLRKERMVSSKGSTSFHGGGTYSYDKHAHRGSSGNAQVRSIGSKKLASGQDSANQIVPYGKGQSSMALAFAFENGGKLKVMDSTGNGSVIGFLKQFGSKKSILDFGRNENPSSIDIRSSSNRFPNLTHLQVKEISKGAQKLHQILRACSNGTNVDSYSIEIGKELLKGALDLEESLRMLVNLQEASDNMSNPRRKNRITLLDENEDEIDGDRITQKQLELPKFSFDKRSRNYRQVSKQQKVMALTYNSSEASNPGVENKASITLNSVSHRRSSSNMSNFSAFLVQEKQSVSLQSKTEKARISSVVAKLMGLDDLPENADSKQVSREQVNSKQKLKMLVSKNPEKRKEDGEAMMLPSPARQKLVKTASDENLETAYRDRNPPWKDFEGTKIVTGSRKFIDNVDKQQNHIDQFIRNKGNQKDSTGNEVKQSSLKLGEQNITKKSEIETSDVIKEKRRSKENASQTERRYSNKLLDSHQKKTWNDPRIQQKPQPQKVFHRAGENKPIGTEAFSKDLSKPVYDAINLQMKHPPMNQVLTAKKSRSAIISAVQFEKFPIGRNRDSTPIEVQTEQQKIIKVVPAAIEEKLVYGPTAQKKKNTKVHKIESHQIIDKVMARKNGTLQSTIKSPKQRSNNFQEIMRDNKFSVSKEAEKPIVSRSKDAVVKSTNLVTNIPPITVMQKSKKEVEEALNLYIAKENRCQLPQARDQNGSFQDIISRITDDQQRQEPKFGTKQESRTASNPHFEIDKESEDISYKYSKPNTAEPLTESEVHLKRILIQNKLFLNTAETLFELNIPIAILQFNGHDWQDQESKLLLDCSYEVMRRKGRKVELNPHPSSMKMIRCLDELVKQLNEEFDKLKLHGRNGNNDAECWLEDYLPKMVEWDVNNTEPDGNCMWDFGWDEFKFAIIENDQVVKRLEKILLNGLIDEITRDLVLQCI